MRDEIDALPQLDPTKYESPADKGRLETKLHPNATGHKRPYNETIELDELRHPFSEPIPLTIQVQNWTNVPGHVYVYRTWTKADAQACERCNLCPHKVGIAKDVDGETVMCTVTIPDDKIEDVIYSPTRETFTDLNEGEGVFVDTWYDRIETGRYHRVWFVAMRPTAWEKSSCSSDPWWNCAFWGREDVIAAMLKLVGPLPWVLLHGDVATARAPTTG